MHQRWASWRDRQAGGVAALRSQSGSVCASLRSGPTKKHLEPLSTAGHRGDLPVLVVDNRSDATEAVTAPHLTVAEIRGRSIMVHAGGDNYSETPVPLSGGGARIAWLSVRLQGRRRKQQRISALKIEVVVLVA
jgi:hypothetical protein